MATREAKTRGRIDDGPIIGLLAVTARASADSAGRASAGDPSFRAADVCLG